MSAFGETINDGNSERMEKIHTFCNQGQVSP